MNKQLDKKIERLEGLKEKEKEKINFKIMQILREENVELAYDTKTVFVKK